MSKQKLNIENIHVSISVAGLEGSGENVKPVNISDSSVIDFSNIDQMDRILNEKPYLKEILPTVIKAMTEHYDATRSSATKLKESLKDFIANE